jgi:hypothetical protein
MSVSVVVELVFLSLVPTKSTYDRDWGEAPMNTV